MKFKYEQWFKEINETHSGYLFLQNPITHYKALEFYYNESGYKENLAHVFNEIHFQRSSTNISDEAVLMAENTIQDSIDEANFGLQLYRRQIIVVAVTIMEAMLKDFLANYFFSKPNTIYSYLNDEQHVGMVSFKVIQKHSSLEALMETLSVEAANRFMKQKWSICFEKIEKLSKAKLPDKELLLQVTTLRHSIIHEGSKVKVADETIENLFRGLCILLDHLKEHSVISDK